MGDSAEAGTTAVHVSAVKPRRRDTICTQQEQLLTGDATNHTDGSPVATSETGCFDCQILPRSILLLHTSQQSDSLLLSLGSMLMDQWYLVISSMDGGA